MLFRHGDAKFRIGGASMQGYRPGMSIVHFPETLAGGAEFFCRSGLV
jgi:hypothetical protein